jgi:hypothetical protein
MRTILEAEHATLLEKAALLDVMLGGDAPTEERLRVTTIRLLEAFKRGGLVLTVSQQSTPPLAMGRYETVFEIREARS